MDREALKQTAKMIADAKQVTFFTGAGVSAESGIPTFRDALTGMWAKYDPEQLATPEAFERNPKLVWQWYDHRRKLLAGIQPNPGHHAIVAMEKLGKKVPVVTQNVDGLHRLAGSKDIYELHGSITSFVCFDRRHEQDNIEMGLAEPPLCHCGSLVRPAVVWFGEALPEDTFRDATRCITRSNLLFVVGTSALVQPAASLPYLALESDIPVIEVNPDETPFTDHATVVLRGKSGEILHELLQLLKN